MSNDNLLLILGVVGSAVGAYFKFAKDKTVITQTAQDKANDIIQKQLEDLRKSDEEKSDKIDELKSLILDMKEAAIKKDFENEKKMADLQRDLETAISLLRKNNIETEGVL